MKWKQIIFELCSDTIAIAGLYCLARSAFIIHSALGYALLGALLIAVAYLIFKRGDCR